MGVANPVGLVLLLRGDLERDRRRRKHSCVMMEPEIGVVCLQAKDGENLGRGEEGFSPESSEGAWPCYTEIQTPGQSWETICLFRAAQSVSFCRGSSTK